MTYVAAADFRQRTIKPYTAGLVLTEADGTDAYVDLVVAQVTTQVELDLGDDFEPAGGDPDETTDVDGYGGSVLYLPRRTRALTTVSTRDAYGTLTAQASSAWRLRSSLNAAGTAMVSNLDELVAQPGLSTTLWPYGTGTVRLVGKFGWAAVPDDIKRLVALRVYGQVKAKADPLTTITQRTTVDAVIIYGPSAEETQIVQRYRRDEVMVG